MAVTSLPGSHSRPCICVSVYSSQTIDSRTGVRIFSFVRDVMHVSVESHSRLSLFFFIVVRA